MQILVFNVEMVNQSKLIFRSTESFMFHFFKAIKPTIISVTASNPAGKELYGLDRRMNMYRSRDSGDTWQQITDGYIKEIQKLTGLVRATPLPENLVSNVPTDNLTAVAHSTGFTWGGKECLIWYFQYLQPQNGNTYPTQVV